MFDNNVFKKLVDDSAGIIEKIFAQLNIKPNERYPMVLGKNNQLLMETYGKKYATAENTDLSSPYLSLMHIDENGDAKFILLHKKMFLRYPAFPALVCKYFPHYNAQVLYETDKTQIAAMEGPKDLEACARMIQDLYKNKINKIYALGMSSELSSHFDYYQNIKDLKISHDFTIFSELENSTQNYLTWKLKSKEKKDFEISVTNFKVIDGNTFDFLNLQELMQIYDEMCSSKLAVHCSAGKGRTSILTLAFILCEENVFTSENTAEAFVNSLLITCEKRPALCPNQSQLWQVYTFGLAFTAFKHNLKAEDFPQDFFKLREAPKKKASERSLAMTISQFRNYSIGPSPSQNLQSNNNSSDRPNFR